MVYLVIFLAFLTINLNPAFAARGEGRNDCHLKQVDECLETIEKVSNDPNSQELLKSEEGLNRICESSLTTATCMESNFKKCATPTHREFFKFFNEYFKQSLNSFCSGKEVKAKFLNESQCIVDEVLKKDDYKNKCVNSYLSTLDKMTPEMDTAIKINTACCSYNRWENCMYTLISQKCGLDARESMTFFVSNALGSTSKSICNDASFKFTSKKCTKLYAPPSAKSKGKNSENPITKYIISYMGFLFQ